MVLILGYQMMPKNQPVNTLQTSSSTQAPSVTAGQEARNGNSNSGLANPASVYCVEQGGKSKIITAPDGSQSGQCVFADGRQCDEWQFFRSKECK